MSINRLHRYVGIVIAPFLVIQTISGLLLSFGMFRRANGVNPASWGIWDRLLVRAHFGPDLLSDICHVLLSAGIIWMAATGWILYLRIRKFQNKRVRVETGR